METWKIYTYDVWCDDGDGFEVNDRYDRGSLELPEDASDEAIVQAVKDFGVFASGALVEEFELDGDDSVVYINDIVNGYPLCELLLEV